VWQLSRQRLARRVDGERREVVAGGGVADVQRQAAVVQRVVEAERLERGNERAADARLVGGERQAAAADAALRRPDADQRQPRAHVDGAAARQLELVVRRLERGVALVAHHAAHDVGRLAQVVPPLAGEAVLLGAPHAVLRRDAQVDERVGDVQHLAVVVELVARRRGGVHEPPALQRGDAVQRRHVPDRQPAGARQHVVVRRQAVHLVVDHVLQPLVEARPHEDGGLQLRARLARVEDLVAVRLQAVLVAQHLAEPLHGDALERRAIA
jgi:hypothetical protein